MKVEINDDVQTMTKAEVAVQLEACGALDMEVGERIKDFRLECGCDFEIDIEMKVDDDPRCSGYDTRTETFTESDIRDWFTNADYCAWAQDEDGEDILLCFGAC